MDEKYPKVIRGPKTSSESSDNTKQDKCHKNKPKQNSKNITFKQQKIKEKRLSWNKPEEIKHVNYKGTRRRIKGNF